LSLSDFDDDIFEVWTENVEAYRLFDMLQTQWRIGSSGPTGLDYNVLFTAMALNNTSNTRQVELLADIRVMESAAIAEIYRKKA